MQNPFITPWQSVLNFPYSNFSLQDPIYSYTCDADVYPSRFVTITGNNSVSQASVGDRIIGISVEYPAVNLGGPAGNTGNPVKVYGNCYECWLLLAQACNYGDSLTSNYEGKGVVGIPSGAIALSNGMAGTLVRVRVHGSDQIANSEYTIEYNADYNRPPE